MRGAEGVFDGQVVEVEDVGEDARLLPASG